MKEESESEYRKAIKLSEAHYENFPVISLFVPAHLKKHVAIIYRFARQADDLADEGTIPDGKRMELLEQYEAELEKALQGNGENPFWKALEFTVREKRLTAGHFFSLLSAFKQDIVKKRYNDFNEILSYCTCSANPVGRLILELYDLGSDRNNYLSDKICTALQLTNFYQDVSLDILKNRIYIPLDEMEAFGVSQSDFEQKKNSLNMQKLIRFQTERARELFLEGSALIENLSGRLKVEIKWTVSGGIKILDKIEKIHYNVVEIRPALSRMDYFSLMIKSLV